MTSGAAEDQFNLQRFVDAQAGVFESVRHELSIGRKSGHWIWFVFPQMIGLGLSPTSQFFGIGSFSEAQAYLAHPVLGPRLIEATQLILTVKGRTLREIFGAPDDMKFRSSMTLFARAAPPGSVFKDALDRVCSGEEDHKTIELLKRAEGAA